eukprot:maker-scaffold17_size721972-snap-gene-6.28 protein:Tk09988 transcript:maker-scaffold17_size721972-snap-gene-6.28-mRNA-1 annotation:"zinc finger mynd domain-containing protein 10"
MELEHISNSLRISHLEEIGTKPWIQQMSMLEELNVQAALEAKEGLEERVRDSLVEKLKLGLVVREMILIEVWREEIMARILRPSQPPESSFQIYMVLFNEANLCNILETLLFHASACQSLDELAIDLTDYCMRQIQWLLSRDPELEIHQSESHKLLEQMPDETPLAEIQQHDQVIRFQVALKCLTILRYLTDNLNDLPLGVSTRMTITHDVPLTLVSILAEEPWIRVKHNHQEIYDGQQWKLMTEDYEAFSTLEAQAWLALYNLMSQPVASQKYVIHDYRKTRLVKYAAQFDDIAEEHGPIFLKNNQELYDKEMSKLIHTFDNPAVQNIISGDISEDKVDTKACVLCNASPAKNRCSRCHSDRYCSRDCQLKHWPKHKHSCSKKMNAYQNKNAANVSKIEEILGT